jgi:adenosylcobinamide-GDP ribazoletransferase
MENRSYSSMLHGLGLAMQFLTALPLRVSFDWTKQTSSWSFRFYPMVGLLLGGLVSIQAYLLMEYVPFSLLMISFYLFTCSIILTGGLHLDGWMDASDAYFSYRDIARRLEIMKDPRTGAFGVLSVLFLLSWRFLFIYESIKLSGPDVWLLFLLIPFLSRTWMGVILVRAPLAKEEGMAFEIRKNIEKSSVQFYGLYAVAATGLGYWSGETMMVLSLLLVSAAGFLFGRRFIIKQFSGITGDSVGAFTEGMETWLWFIGWLLLSFVMA